MNVRLLPAAGIVVCLLLVWRFVGAGTNASFEDARKIILFRQIGRMGRRGCNYRAKPGRICFEAEEEIGKRPFSEHRQYTRERISFD